MLLRSKGDKKSIPIARVDLPLVSNFGATSDERYPIRSIHGEIIGEIRLSVAYQEIDVIELAEYNGLVRRTGTPHNPR